MQNAHRNGEQTKKKRETANKNDCNYVGLRKSSQMSRFRAQKPILTN